MADEKINQFEDKSSCLIDENKKQSSCLKIDQNTLK